MNSEIVDTDGNPGCFPSFRQSWLLVTGIFEIQNSQCPRRKAVNTGHSRPYLNKKVASENK